MFLIPAAFVAVVIVGVILAIYFNARWERQRTEALRGVANGLSFEFYASGDPAAVTELGEFHLFQHGRAKKIANLMQGQAHGLTISLFDYTYVIGHGKHQQTIKQSVFVARRGGMQLPGFTLRPASFWQRIGSWLGFKDIDFDTHPIFSKAYLLKGADEAAIRAVFTDPVLDYFSARPNLYVEGNGERLLYYRGERSAPEKMLAFMAEGFEVLNLFPPN